MPSEIEIRKLVRSGVARDEEHAKQILVELEQKRQRADMILFYTDVTLVRSFFKGELIDERPYNFSNILVAGVPSGSLDKAAKKPQENRILALGRIMEFVSQEDRQDTKLVVWIKNIGYGGKEGIFLSSYSAENVHAKGKTTFDEKHNLYRIEFRPISEDFIFGIFHTWNQHPINQQASLILYIARARVIVLP